MCECRGKVGGVFYELFGCVCVCVCVVKQLPSTCLAVVFAKWQIVEVK